VAPPAPPPKVEPLEFTSDGTYIRIKGHGGYISVLPAGTECSIDVHDGDPGMTISIAGQTRELAAGGNVELRVNMLRRVRDSTLNELKKVTLDEKLLVKIHDQRGEVALTPVDLTNIGGYIRDGLKKGPFLFGADEPPDPQPHDCLMVVGYGTPQVFPPTCKLGQIDEVAVVEIGKEPKGKKRCRGYGQYGLPTDDLDMTLFETVVAVYDRRTGATVETKRLPPLTECPRVVSLTPGQREIWSGLAWPKALAWAKARVKQKY
jgi:hypothetical protein